MLRVEGLAAGYGDVPVLQDISLHVQPGETVALLGPNGAGKSTLLRAISGQIACTRGRVQAGGQDCTNWPAHAVVRCGVAHVPEGRGLFAQMTVRENLLLGAYLRPPRERPAALEQVFRLFPRLAERQEQAAGTLSGGEQQMVAIGRGLMSGPRLLLLDEPSLGLAPVMVEQIFAAIATLGNGGLAVLLVEQNVGLALRIAQRGYVLEGGRLVLAGSGPALLADRHVQAAYLGGLRPAAAGSREGG